MATVFRPNRPPENIPMLQSMPVEELLKRIGGENNCAARLQGEERTELKSHDMVNPADQIEVSPKGIVG